MPAKKKPVTVGEIDGVQLIQDMSTVSTRVKTPRKPRQVPETKTDDTLVSNIATLNVNPQQVVATTKLYLCVKCDKEYKSKSGLKRHDVNCTTST